MNVTVSHTISMGHRLPSYDGICSSPHGHNVTVEVTIYSKLFLDFKIVSDVLRRVLGDFDHAMVLHDQDLLAAELEKFDFRMVLLNVEPTTENIAQYIHNCMWDNFRGTTKTVVHETARYSATVTSPTVQGEVVRVR